MNRVVFSIVLGVALFASACDADSPMVGNPSSFGPLALPGVESDSAGDLHNYGLDEIADELDTTYLKGLPNTLSEVQYVADIVGDYYEAEGLNLEYFVYGEVVDSITALTDGSTTIENVWVGTQTITLIDDSLTSNELDFISDCIDAADFDASSMTIEEVSDELADIADSLTTEWHSQSWGTDGSSEISGELSRGYLDVLEGSANYWGGTTVEPFDNGTPATQFLIGEAIRMDALGYIVGWVKAVVKEVDETGDLARENEAKRIAAGIDGAATTSGVNLLAKALKWVGIL